MKVFLSYRRDDTGGRAGRLFDVLVARFGARSVFQDVNAVAPGLDFTAQVEAAIEASDVVLVVIGPKWLGGVDPDGGRRIDRPEDFVRQEVSRALASGIPVVPVLVEGVSLPPADELPDDVAPLVLRQAVTLRDVSWHNDVNDLIRRLEGDHWLASRRRRWPIVVGVGLAAVVAVIVVAVIIQRSGDGGSSSPPDPPCETDNTWTAVDLVEDPTHVAVDAGETLDFEVRRALYRLDGSGGAEVVLDVAGTNLTEPAPDDTVPSVYFGEGWIEGLLVDRVLQSDVSCWGPVNGDPNLQPDQRAIITMGFDSKIDPTGVPLALELSDLGALQIATPA
jgi:TIR domain